MSKSNTVSSERKTGGKTATLHAGVSEPPASRTMSCVVVEDQVMFLDLLAGLLMVRPRLHVAAQVGDLASGVTACRRLKPDLLVLDLALPDGDGLEVAREFLDVRPDGRVIVLSGHASDFVCPAWLNAGLQAVISKNAAFDVLRRELDELLGTLPVPVAGRAESDPVMSRSLTEREAEVFVLMGDGLSTAEIAARLNVSEHTVHTHRKRMAAKLGTQGDELVRRAVAHRMALSARGA